MLFFVWVKDRWDPTDISPWTSTIGVDVFIFVSYGNFILVPYVFLWYFPGFIYIFLPLPQKKTSFTPHFL